jgi:hypothetical protein
MKGVSFSHFLIAPGLSFCQSFVDKFYIIINTRDINETANKINRQAGYNDRPKRHGLIPFAQNTRRDNYQKYISDFQCGFQYEIAAFNSVNENKARMYQYVYGKGLKNSAEKQLAAAD